MNQYLPLMQFAAALRDAGVEDVVISPGSRSTPLALAFAHLQGIRRHILIDERSAAYFALGLGLSGGRPAALVCTSGTAAANYMPAVVEARFGHVPLVVLTADRPRELRDVGANQTIDQTRIYGQHVNWFIELPTDGDEAAGVLAYARTAGLRAVAMALGRPFGPVHVNIPLREPLLPPEPLEAPAPVPSDLRTAAPEERSPAPLVDEAARRITRARSGVIVAGPLPPSRHMPDLPALARATGFPILADPLSGLRSLPGDTTGRLDAYDLYLRDANLRQALEPELVLRVGGMPTSKSLGQWLQAMPEGAAILLPGEATWQDPLLQPGLLLPGAAHLDVAALLGRVEPETRSRTYMERFMRVDRATRAAAEAFLARTDPFEPTAIRLLAGLLGTGDQLFVGSSMPVRDLDGFLPTGGGQRILAMRGAQGIDGVVSAAVGAARRHGGRTALAIGDLSFLHDFGGLYAATRTGTSLTVLLLHNDGGGIFSYLPQHGMAEFEELFGTPTGIDFAPGIAMFGGRHRQVLARQDLVSALGEALDRPGLDVVELRTDREASRTLHGEVFAAAQAVARAALIDA